MPIILRALSVFLAVTFIEMAKEFKEVGAAKLHDYSWADWMVCIVGIGAVGFVALNAFFSTAYSQHLDRIHSGDTERWRKAELAKPPPKAEGGE